MLVIGIDPGTAITGYGLLRQVEESEELFVEDFGVIRTPGKLDMAERLFLLHSKLSDIVSFHRPDSAAVEKLFFQKNVKTAISVGQGRGVAILALAQAKLPVFEYSPLEVKLAVAGYGGADKSQIQQMVQILLHLDDPPQPDDAADALAIAICHLHSSKIKSLSTNNPS
jgi:crossover junction endodeoxyribonuclease RuvC